MTIEKQSKEFKELFIKELNKQDLNAEQIKFIINWLELRGEESNIFTVMTKVITEFKVRPTSHFSLMTIPSELFPMTICQKLVIVIHNVREDSTNLELHDKYLMHLTIHVLMYQTSPLLFNKLMRLYYDIKAGIRSLDDIELDLALLDKYEHKNLSVLFYLIKEYNYRLEHGAYKLNEATTKELSKRLFVDTNRKRYEGQVKINNKLNENEGNENDN